MDKTLVKEEKSMISDEYKKLLKEIKEKVRTSQLKAAVAVNTELIKLYWEIGNAVYQKQQSEGWGAKVSEKLGNDLKSAFPDMKGFSPRNLRFMVQFTKEYPDPKIGKQLVSQIPWGHNILIMQRLNNNNERLWYVNQTIEKGWSRSVLLHWIDSELHKRQARAVTNFQDTLPSAHSDLAQETLKDPYCFALLHE